MTPVYEVPATHLRVICLSALHSPKKPLTVSYIMRRLLCVRVTLIAREAF
jgi:hypothetical protein